MKNTLKLAAAAALIALLPSCTQMTPSGTETIPQARVKLTENNYRVLATRVSAEDKGFSLLPIAGTAAKVITLGAFNHVIPNGLTIKSPSEAAALDKLYRQSGASRTGRATQLINIRKEVGGLNAFIIGRPTIRVTADLIEFTR